MSVLQVVVAAQQWHSSYLASRSTASSSAAAHTNSLMSIVVPRLPI